MKSESHSSFGGGGYELMETHFPPQGTDEDTDQRLRVLSGSKSYCIVSTNLG